MVRNQIARMYKVHRQRIHSQTATCKTSASQSASDTLPTHTVHKEPRPFRCADVLRAAMHVAKLGGLSAARLGAKRWVHTADCCAGVAMERIVGRYVRGIDITAGNQVLILIIENLPSPIPSILCV